MSVASMPEIVAGPWDSTYHTPVLAEEVVRLLGGARSVLDGTLGGGGHSLALLASGSDVTAVDRDPDAINAARCAWAPTLLAMRRHSLLPRTR